MRTRHRIPNIFNLSMVDVLCCALGCVILLWLLNLKDARQRAAEAGQTDRALLAARQERDELFSSAAGLLAELDETARREAEARAQLRTALQREQDAAARLAAAGRREADLTAKHDAARQELARQADAYRALERKLQEGARRLAAMQGQVEKSGGRADDLGRQLAAAQDRLKDLAATADLVPGLREQLKEAREKHAREEALARGLEREIDKRMKAAVGDARRIEALQETQRRLEQALAAKGREVERADRLRAAALERFAGIALTGRRVVFLIDMSGSMKYVEPDKEAPEKWQGVRDTVAQILRSLPELEKFQVIVFAEKAAFLLGGEGRWLDYDPKASADRALRALAATEPKGGTNMYAALDAAFRLRADGLDTIYLLSDGLPNMGEGLTPRQEDELKETEKAEILGRVIRKKLKEEWNRPGTGRPRVRINAIGFFYESPDVGAFLWALARENDGSFVGMSRP